MTLVTLESTVSKPLPDRPQVRNNIDWLWYEYREDPELERLFRNAVLTLLSIDRCQTEDRNKRDQVQKKLRYYNLITGFCGTSVGIIGAGRLALEAIPVILTPVTTFVLASTVTSLGFITTVFSILARREPYLEKSKDVPKKLEKARGNLLEFRGKLMEYDPTRDEGCRQFLLLYADFSAQQENLRWIEFFRQLEYENLTGDEKRQAFEHKSGWYARRARRVPGKNGSQL
jgi:hypothetical protein